MKSSHPTNLALLLALAIPVAAIAGYLLWSTRDIEERRQTARRQRGLAAPKALRKAFPSVTHGLAVATPLAGGRPIVVPPEQSVGLILPPRKGKSASAVGYILDACGPVVATSSKAELLLVTATIRTVASKSETVVFDPLGITGWPNVVRWSPVAGCEQPAVAVRRADALMAGMRSDGLSDAGFFRSAGSMLLRVVLHAAALDGRGVAQVRRWVGNPHDTALAALVRRSPYASEWMSDLRMVTESHGRTLQSIALTTAVALSCLALPDVADACSPTVSDAFDPAAWLTSGGTLHVVAPDAEGASVAPLTAALVDEVVIAARTAAAATPAGRLDPPLRLVLDELPSICPLPNVDSYLADGGGRGIQVVWMAQARSQLDDVFGAAKARTILAATNMMLWGGGLHDADLLRDLSAMLGDVEKRTAVRSSGRSGPSRTEHVHHVAVMEPAAIFALPAFQALAMSGGLGGVVVKLQPWWERRDAKRIRSAIAEADTIRRHPVQR